MFDREEICANQRKTRDEDGRRCCSSGNEWKTRFENQEEINRHLARQIILLERNIEQAKDEQKMGKPDECGQAEQDIGFFHLAKTRAAKADPNEVGRCSFLLCWKKEHSTTLQGQSRCPHHRGKRKEESLESIAWLRMAIGARKQGYSKEPLEFDHVNEHVSRLIIRRTKNGRC